MKLLWILALIINVTGYGEIPETGMDLTIREAEEDPMSGEMMMQLKGDLLCTTPLRVSISRLAEGLTDEFCCAGVCSPGNGEQNEELEFMPNGIATWFIHYTPVWGTNVTVHYLFEDDTDSRYLTVHYLYGTQGIEKTDAETIRQGVYTLTGTRVQSGTDLHSLPAGIYVTPEKKIIKTY